MSTISATNSTSPTDAYHQHAWSGGFNVASVDLIAMLVSDAGLASTEPQWWNASPIGCVLLGLQPRGGWQVMQRAVQWGGDGWAHCFGVSCKVPVLYAYFACSIRNRLEVWRSERFISPMEDQAEDPVATQMPLKCRICNGSNETCSHTKFGDAASTSQKAEKQDAEVADGAHPISPGSTPTIEPIRTRADSALFRSDSRGAKKPKPEPEKHSDTSWNQINRGLAGVFTVKRPTKLIDGSRGGQAFMCGLLCPEPGKAYSVEEQARLQLLSVILIVAGLTKDQTYDGILEVIREDFEVSNRLGIVFTRLMRGLVLVGFMVLGLTVVVFYALWYNNVFGSSVPYVIQLCSMFSWASGAVGLLMLGGNPRVQIDQNKPAPKHIQERLDLLDDGYAILKFGSLHGSVFVNDQGTCGVPCDIVKLVSRWRLTIRRSWHWHMGMIWFSLFLLLSITLQIASSTVATTRSQVLSIVLLISTSVLRGAGISGPESWMIPQRKRRKNAKYAVKLQGQFRSRVSVSETSG